MTVLPAPAPYLIAESTWALHVPIENGSMPYTIAYLLRDASAGIHVIDPGVSTEQSWAVLTSAIAMIGGRLRDVASITATHFHHDHLGLAGRLRSATNAPVGIGAADADRARHPVDGSIPSRILESWGVPLDRRPELGPKAQRDHRVLGTSIDIELDDGDLLPVPGRSIRVMATPGHTPGHIALVDDGSELYFAGDQILPDSNPGLGLGGIGAGDPIADSIRSLAHAARLGEWQVAPGHEHPFFGLATRAGQLAEHHLRRAGEIAKLRGMLPAASTWEIASQVTWTRGFDQLHGGYLSSALNQTALHLAFVHSDFGARLLEDGFGTAQCGSKPCDFAAAHTKPEDDLENQPLISLLWTRGDSNP